MCTYKHDTVNSSKKTLQFMFRLLEWVIKVTIIITIITIVI